jgi:hypothetical protein
MLYLKVVWEIPLPLQWRLQGREATWPRQKVVVTVACHHSSRGRVAIGTQSFGARTVSIRSGKSSDIDGPFSFWLKRQSRQRSSDLEISYAFHPHACSKHSTWEFEASHPPFCEWNKMKTKLENQPENAPGQIFATN